MSQFLNWYRNRQFRKQQMQLRCDECGRFAPDVFNCMGKFHAECYAKILEGE